MVTAMEGSAPSMRPTKRPKAARPRYSRLAQQLVSPETRREMIAQAAYFRAQRRGFEAGKEVQDWLAAEIEVDTALTLGEMTD
jgi:hypothetical protein